MLRERRQKMTCPNCGNKNIDTRKAQGYTPITHECLKCGEMWFSSTTQKTTLKKGKDVLLE